MSETGFAELISKIAHELRSPLTSVKGFSATLIARWDRFTDEQRYQLIETIHADAERMGRIVSEVLDLARLESNRLELHRTNVNLRAVAEKALERSAGRGGAARVVIEVPEDLTAHVDHERIDSVVSNLVENAIKFSDDGPIRVTGAEGSDGTVSLTVEDAGVGIPEERLPELFSGPAPRGQKAAPTGTGLGLYLSRRLVEEHGGSITVESTVDEGSTFTIELPGVPATDA
jgi:signal transduction histidine kinase